MKHKFGIAILGLLMSICTSCGIVINVDVETYPNADKYLVGNQTYEEELTNLDINWINGKVYLIEDENIIGVKVEEETTLTKEEQQVHSYFNNGTLDIKYFASGYSYQSDEQYTKNLTVTYKPGLTNINLHLTGGEIHASKVTTKNLDVDIVSGSADIGGVTAEKVDVDLVSGSCSIKFTSVDNGDFSLISGNIEMELPTEGGIVEISKISGTVNAKREHTLDGDKCIFGEGTSNIKVSIISGNLTIK